MQSLTKSSAQSQNHHQQPQSQHNPQEPGGGQIGGLQPSQSSWQQQAAAATLHPGSAGDAHYSQYHYFYYPGASELAFGPGAGRAPLWSNASTGTAGATGQTACYALSSAHYGVLIVIYQYLYE